MPPLTPKQLKKFPPTPVPPPPLRAFRVARSFSYDGRTFHVGEMYSLDSTLAQAIHAEYPESSRPLAEDFGLERPTPAEIEESAALIERACRVSLSAHVGEQLDLPDARSVYFMRSWARLDFHASDERPLSVCFGRTALKLTDRQTLRTFWSSVEGRDGCLVVFEGRGRNCPRCHRSRCTRWKTIEAEANANRRGLLTYPVWYPDGSIAIARVGRCACGTEFQTEVASKGRNRTRCDECRARHRVRSQTPHERRPSTSA